MLRPILIAAAIFIASAVVALLFGSERASLLVAVTEPASLDRVLLFDVRLPRLVLAAIAGAGLSLVGGSFQDLLGVGARRACLRRVIRCSKPSRDEELGGRRGQRGRRYLQQTCSRKLTLTC